MPLPTGSPYRPTIGSYTNEHISTGATWRDDEVPNLKQLRTPCRKFNLQLPPRNLYSNSSIGAINLGVANGGGVLDCEIQSLRGTDR